MMKRIATAALCAATLGMIACGDAPPDAEAEAASGKLDHGDAGEVSRDNAMAKSDPPEWLECSEVPADCMEAACDDSNLCGIGGSPYDTNMCLRPECADDDDCATGRVCTLVHYAPVSCGYHTPGVGDCACGNLAMVRSRSVCLIQKDSKWKEECSEVPADCMEAACDLGLCGRGSSRYDENMCLRPVCTDDDDCEPGTQCTFVGMSDLDCRTDVDAGLCDCETDESRVVTDWICLGPG